MATFRDIELESKVVTQGGTVIPLHSVDGVTVRGGGHPLLPLSALGVALAGVALISSGRLVGAPMFLVTGAVSGLVAGLMVLFYLQTKATCLTIFAGAVRITAAVNANEGGDAKTFARQVALSCVADR